MSKDQICQCIKSLDQQRCALLDQLESADEAKLMHKPKPEDWSALGIAQHLMLSEHFMLENLPDHSTLKPKKTSLKGKLMYPVATFVLNKNISVSAPPQVTPDDSLSLSELRQKWDESQAWLKTLSQCDAAELEQALINHPILGPLPTLKLVQFIQTHFDYHNRQIQQRLAS